MARINLLPWRKEQRERRNKEFNLLAGATAGLAILATILVLSILNRELTNQQNANKHIEDANAQLDIALKSIEELEVKREQMLSQMKVIQDLQGRRSIPVRVWDDMARAIPEAMYLNNIKREADVITLTGLADNPNVVAALVRNLNASEWLDGSAVVSIKSKLEAYQSAAPKMEGDNARQPYPEDNYVEFVVTTKVQHPQTEEEAKAQTEQSVDEQNVALPPVTTQAEALPEVAPIGIENAPVSAEVQNNTASVSEPQNSDVSNTPALASNNDDNIPVVNEQTVAPQPNAQPAPNGDNQAGGQ